MQEAFSTFFGFGVLNFFLTLKKYIRKNIAFFSFAITAEPHILHIFSLTLPSILCNYETSL